MNEKLRRPSVISEKLAEAEKRNQSEELQEKNAPLVISRLHKLTQKIIPQESIKRRDDTDKLFDPHHLRVDIEFPVERGGVKTDVYLSRGTYPFTDTESQIEEAYAIRFGTNSPVHIISSTTLMRNGMGYDLKDLDILNEVIDFLSQGIDSGEITPSIISPQLG